MAPPVGFERTTHGYETDAQDVFDQPEAVTPVGPKAFPQMRVTAGYERHDQPIAGDRQ